MHQPRIRYGGFHSELMFDFGCSMVKAYWRSVDKLRSKSATASHRLNGHQPVNTAEAL